MPQRILQTHFQDHNQPLILTVEWTEMNQNMKKTQANQSLALSGIVSDIRYVASFRNKGNSKVTAGEKSMRNFESFHPSKTTAQRLLKYSLIIAQEKFSPSNGCNSL